MCTPAVAIGLTVASTGLSMMSQMQANDAQEAQMRHQAAVQRAQADAQREQALHTIKNAEKFSDSIQGSLDEGQRAKRDILLRGEYAQRQFEQNIAGKNIFVGSDSVVDELDLIGDVARGDAERAYDNYERQALGFKQQQDDMYFNAEQMLKGANQSLMNASFYDAQANFDDTLGLLSTAIGGASAVAGQYLDFKEAGYFGGDAGKTETAMAGSYSGFTAYGNADAYGYFKGGMFPTVR